VCGRDRRVKSGGGSDHPWLGRRRFGEQVSGGARTARARECAGGHSRVRQGVDAVTRDTRCPVLFRGSSVFSEDSIHQQIFWWAFVENKVLIC